MPGNGLTANYYANSTFESPPTLTRVDPEIDFDWADMSGSPGDGILDTDFSVTWTGFLLSPVTDLVTFYILSSGPASLTIAGNLVSSDSSGIFTGAAGLTHGVYTPIQVTFSSTSAPAYMHLMWYQPQDFQLKTVAQERLYTAKPRPAPTNPPGRNVSLFGGVTNMPTWRATQSESDYTNQVRTARVACGISGAMVTIVACPPDPTYPARAVDESVRVRTLATTTGACIVWPTAPLLNPSDILRTISLAIANVRNPMDVGVPTNPASMTTSDRAKAAAFDASGNLRYQVLTGGPDSHTTERRAAQASTCAVSSQPITAAAMAAARFPEFFKPALPNYLAMLSTNRMLVSASLLGAAAINPCPPR